MSEEERRERHRQNYMHVQVQRLQAFGYMQVPPFKFAGKPGVWTRCSATHSLAQACS